MTESSDVLVVGAGPAGLAAAIAIRRLGFSTAVLDGGRPPNEKACGEGLLPESLAALNALGVHFGSSEGHVLSGIRFVSESAQVDAQFPAALGLGIRRRTLHEKLLTHAESIGVHVRWQTPVSISASGLDPAISRQFRFIVAADGLHSRLRALVVPTGPKRRGQRIAFCRHYGIRPWTGHVEVHWSGNSQAYVTPVGPEEISVAVIAPAPGVRTTALAEKFPALARRIGSAPATSPERGASTTSLRLPRVTRGNVALVGDAAGAVDAITGEGLGLSFRSAAALAHALRDDNLARYEEAHRNLFRTPARMSQLLLQLGQHSVIRRRVMNTFQQHPDLFTRFLALHAAHDSRSAQLAAAAGKLVLALVTS